MSRVLIAGCGYVGSATGSAFQNAEWEVEGWTSSGGKVHSTYEVSAVDLTDAGAVKKAGGAFDVVIHCGSSRGGHTEDYRRIYLDGARNLAAAFSESLLVFTSSTSVYAQQGGEWVDEESPAEPTTETAKILRETEEFVLERGGIVVRLAGIYGPGRSALLRKFLAATATVDTVPRFLNHIHRDDVVSALLLLTQRAIERQLTGSPFIFNVSDDHPILQRDACEWLAAHFQKPLPPVSFAPGTRKRGNTNKRISSKKLQTLGWRPQFPTFQSAMLTSILTHSDEESA